MGNYDHWKTTEPEHDAYWVPTGICRECRQAGPLYCAKGTYDRVLCLACAMTTHRELANKEGQR